MASRSSKSKTTDRQPPADMGLAHTHAVLGQLLGSVFSELQLSASLLGIEGSSRYWNWRPIHYAPQEVISSELAHDKAQLRSEYNARMVERAYREGKLVMGEHAGFHDLFVPIRERGRPFGLLVTGPFLAARPSASSLLSNWRWLTGSQGRLSDPEFAHYVSCTLATATFEGPLLATFRQLVSCLADLLSECGKPETIATEVQRLMAELDLVRRPERMWQAAHGLIDERKFRAWTSMHRARELSDLGLRHAPEHVVVGLLSSSRAHSDPLDDHLRRDAFQRACVDACLRWRGLVCCPIGVHGVALLSDAPPSASRRVGRLTDVAERVAALAKRFGLELHAGIASSRDGDTLPRRAQAALAAAEQALTRNVTLSYADGVQKRLGVGLLAGPRRQLVLAARQGNSALIASFDRYLEAVTAQSGYRFEPTLAHLSAALDQVLEALRDDDALDPKALTGLMRSLDQAGIEATTVEALATLYRGIVADIERALAEPVVAEHERLVRRASTYMRDHLSEPLYVARVARIAGLAPGYFSKVFLRVEGSTFRRYLARLRIERAKYLLSSTALSAERIGKLSGYPSRSHFHRVFRQVVQMAPLQYRQRYRKRFARLRRGLDG